jgi:hypothetical protein
MAKTILPRDANLTPLYGYDLDEDVVKHGNLVWDDNLWAWVKMTQPTINAGNLNIDLTSTNGILDDIEDLLSEAGNEKNLIRKIDERSATIMYIGEAASGTAATDSQWRIKRVDMSDGIEILFAEGVTTFSNPWTSRATLSYL